MSGINPLFRTELSVESGFLRFRGDQSFSKFSSGNICYGASLHVGYQAWKSNLFGSTGQITWNEQSSLNRINFQSTFQHYGIQLGRSLFNPNEGKTLNMYAMLGVSFMTFNSYTDLKDKNGILYHYWSDGTIRNLPEASFNQSNSSLLLRDYTYESPLAIAQKSICFPLEIGVSAQITHRIAIDFSWKSFFLQSDNLDRNTDNPQWDNINQISGRLKFTLNVNPARNKKNKQDVNPQIHYKDVDFASIWYADEDGDGVNDMNDRCAGTPKGFPVDKNGCTADSDEDGIPDFIDQQLQTPKYTWVDNNGVERDEHWVKEHYADSSSYFVQVLRKINRNSRPYPVKKYMSEENLKQWNILLEVHPEWRVRVKNEALKFPLEFQKIDSNNDQFISISELEKAANDLFEGKNGITVELFQKAMTYAFRDQ